MSKLKKLPKFFIGKKFHYTGLVTADELEQLTAVKKAYNELGWKCMDTPNNWICPLIIYKRGFCLRKVYVSNSYILPLNIIKKLKRLNTEIEICIYTSHEIRRNLLSELEYSNIIGYPVITPNQLQLKINNSIPKIIIEYSPLQFQCIYSNRSLPKPGEVYKHFKGNMYKILNYVFNCNTEKDMVLYSPVDNPNKFYCRNIQDFMSNIDKNKYPNVLQKYKFEKIY